MSLLEIIAFILGVINVTLVVRRSVWNYPFGIVMVVLYGQIFFAARLYSDALLQIFFFVIQIYGWVHWARRRAADGEVRVETMTARARLFWALGTCAVIGGWGALMHRFTDASQPWWDASIAILSVAAQLLMSRRKIENWAVWITVDIGSIGLYAVKELWLTMLLYAIFLALACWGLIDWQRAHRRISARVAA